MANPNLQKVIKLTQSQYNTLANGGTVGDFTGLNDNYLYLIQEDYEFPTTTTARKILMSTSTAGLVSWQSLTANDIPSLDASKINSGVFSTSRIPNLNASKITGGTFDIARIPTGTTASTVALGNHNHDSIYLGINDTAANSSKLNGQAASYYAPKAWVGENYLGISAKAADSDLLDGHDSSYFATSTHTHTAANIISWLGLGSIRSASSMTWGTLTTANGYTILLATDQPNGGGWVIAEKDGKTYMQIDGDFYVNEGRTRLARVGEAQPASDVYAWAKAATKPSYTYSEVGAAAASHTHTKSQITDFPTSMPADGGTADYIWCKGSSPDNAYIGGKLSAFYSWDQGGPANSYSIGLTIGGHPSDPYYGWQIAQSLWSDDLYYRRRDQSTGSFTSWLKVLNPTNGLSREPWWNDSDSHSPNDLGSGITFAYSSHGTPTTGTLVSFAGIGGSCESYRLQIQGAYYSNQLFYRNRNGDNGTWGDWREVIHSGNIGSQSVNYANSAGSASYASSAGNADTLDSHDSSYFYPASNPNSYTSVTESTVSGWGFTKNIGTVTSITLGLVAYNPDSGGVVALPAYPTTLPASDVYAWAKEATKPTYTASEVGALASDAKVVLYTLQSLSAAQRLRARANIGAGTSDLALGNTATTAAAGNHTHTLSITSGGSSPTTLAADTTYTLTAGGSTLVFKTPAAGGGSAYYANQYNQWYYFSNSSSPRINSKIGLTNITTYNYANLFFGFDSIPEDYATSLSYGHNIHTCSRAFVMDFAIGSGYMSQLVFGTIGYDITKIYARNINAYGGNVGEPDDVSNLGTLYLVASSLNASIVHNNSLYEFAIGRKNHCIHFSSGSNHAFFNILNTDFYTYSAAYQIASALYNSGHRSITSFLRASGIYGGYSKPVVGVYATNGSTLWIVYMNGTTVTSSSFTSGNVADSEINTVYEP